MIDLLGRDGKLQMTNEEWKQLQRFSSKARKQNREGTIPLEKKERLESVGFDFRGRVYSNANIDRSSWMTTLKIWKVATDEHADFVWLKRLIQPYKSSKFKDQVATTYTSMQHLVVTALKVGDIAPQDCKRSCDVWDIRHTLSYIVTPLRPQEELPNRMLKTTQIIGNFTRYFGPEQCAENAVLWEAMQDFVDDVIPSWIVEFNDRGLSSTISNEDDLVKMVQSSEHSFFDPFLVRKGSSFREHKSLVVLTRTKQPGPRRFNLHDTLPGSERFSKRFNCTIYEGYSYTLSFCMPYLYYGRPLDGFPALARLKLEVWKAVWEYLSPISKVCPPNGVQVLTYFRMFKNRINPHKDMNPDMQVDVKTNSQIIGSNVIVVSFLASQFFEFLKEARASGERYGDSLITEHCSIYILDPEDDVNFYHHARFGRGSERHDVRVAVTLRWLGARKVYIGEDYKGSCGDRRYQEAVDGVRKMIKEIKCPNKRLAHEKAARRRRLVN